MDRAVGLTLLRRAAAIAAAAFCLAAGPPGGADPVGAWDLALQDSPRRCRITLGEADASGRTLYFPAGCRRALPILRDAFGWQVADGGVRLLDRTGDAVLIFETAPGAEAAFAARTDAGERYRMERAKDVGREARAALPPPLTLRLPGTPRQTPIDPATAPPFASLPGTYALDRYTEQDVCRLALTQAPAGTAGAYEVRLLDPCRDRGIQTFDPVAWHYVGGRLTLTARRGHEVTLISEHPDRWRRDPEVGATLTLRKVE